MINIDLKSRIPIYEQIINEIKSKVIANELKPDEQLPSIRQLTQALGINPNTIQKSFAELERQGIIYSLAGRGSFISSEVDIIKNMKKAELENEFVKKVNEMYNMGIEKSVLTDIINEIYDKNP